MQITGGGWEQRVLADPQPKIHLQKARNEEEAKQLVSKQLGDRATVIAAKSMSKGKRGFLGIGASPNEYEIEIFQKARVRVTYSKPATVVAVIGTRDDAYVIRLVNEMDNALVEAEREMHKAILRTVGGGGVMHGSSLENAMDGAASRYMSRIKEIQTILVGLGDKAVPGLKYKMNKASKQCRASIEDILAEIGKTSRQVK